MKIRRAVSVLPLFVAAYLFAFAAPPVYPGAKAVDELNEAAKKAGQNTTAYNTPDAFRRRSTSSTKAKALRSPGLTGLVREKNSH